MDRVEVVKTCPVTTSKFGGGCADGSYQTPVGIHSIFEKFGEGEEIGTMFKNREKTGEICEIYKEAPGEKGPVVITRILQIQGLEEKNINTLDRYIYIHGTNHEWSLGKPDSLGCIRMKNDDVVELFDLVDKETLVYIVYGKEILNNKDIYICNFLFKITLFTKSILKFKLSFVTIVTFLSCFTC